MKKVWRLSLIATFCALFILGVTTGCKGKPAGESKTSTCDKLTKCTVEYHDALIAKMPEKFKDLYRKQKDRHLQMNEKYMESATDKEEVCKTTLAGYLVGWKESIKSYRETYPEMKDFDLPDSCK